MGGAALDALIAAERLPDAYHGVAKALWWPLACEIEALRHRLGRPVIVGIQGGQGTGKSTMVLFLEHFLGAAGLRVARLSLDDLYLTKAARRDMAQRVHPLFATRGVPGTHDVDLGEQVLTQLVVGQGDVALPRFSKADDDRAPVSLWPVVAAPVDIVLFEGWCVGVPPQSADALETPVNDLERGDDGDGHWRRAVNDALGGAYRRLFDRIDTLIVLQPDDFDHVLLWRDVQESKLAQRTMDTAALRRFVMHYERLTRHAMAVMPARADALFLVGKGHQIRKVDTGTIASAPMPLGP